MLDLSCEEKNGGECHDCKDHFCVSLSGNKFGDSGATTLGMGLVHWPGLTILDISGE
jgi:hypothetical protein